MHFLASTQRKPALRTGDLRLWYDPAQPNLCGNTVPIPNLFFASLLIIWMPYRFWSMRLLCPKPCGSHLAGARIYKWVKQDIDTYYNMATENVVCNKCGKKSPGGPGSARSWAQEFISSCSNLQVCITLQHYGLFILSSSVVPNVLRAEIAD